MGHHILWLWVASFVAGTVASLAAGYPPVITLALLALGLVVAAIILLADRAL